MTTAVPVAPACGHNLIERTRAMSADGCCPLCLATELASAKRWMVARARDLDDMEGRMKTLRRENGLLRDHLARLLLGREHEKGPAEADPSVERGQIRNGDGTFSAPDNLPEDLRPAATEKPARGRATLES